MQWHQNQFKIQIKHYEQYKHLFIFYFLFFVLVMLFFKSYLDNLLPERLNPYQVV